MNDKAIGSGLEPRAEELLTATGQEIIIDGKKYLFRRLTTRDVLKFSRLMFGAMKSLGNIDIQNPEHFGLVLLAGLGEADREVGEFYGSLIGMTNAEFMATPPEFLVEFLSFLPQQYDLNAFFGAVLKATKSLASLYRT